MYPKAMFYLLKGDYIPKDPALLSFLGGGPSPPKPETLNSQPNPWFQDMPHILLSEPTNTMNPRETSKIGCRAEGLGSRSPTPCTPNPTPQIPNPETKLAAQAFLHLVQSDTGQNPKLKAPNLRALSHESSPLLYGLRLEGLNPPRNSKPES